MKPYRKVAPYVGAWIETFRFGNEKEECSVAPYVGAWIETFWAMPERKPPVVAPYVGAWIETQIKNPLLYCVRSHPTWVRGLKHNVAYA